MAPRLSDGEFAAIAVGLTTLAFALGSIPVGLLIGKWFFHTDIRTAGSGNIGSANALRAFGKVGAGVVLILDVLKGLLPTSFGLLLVMWMLRGPQPLMPWLLAPASLGFAALLGHCYTPWLKFNGGKGVATHLGVTFGLAWPAGLVFIAVWLATAVTSGYASAGSLVAALVSIFALGYFAGPIGAVYGIAATGLIFWRHRVNIKRLRAGSEHRTFGKNDVPSEAPYQGQR